MTVMKVGVCLSHWWLATALAAFCLPGQAASNRPGPLVAQKAPAFHIHGIYNEDYSLETFEGHIRVMQFGTSW